MKHNDTEDESENDDSESTDAPRIKKEKIEDKVKLP